jgi:chromate reductase
MASVKILAFAGSARRDSFNKLLVKIAVAGAMAAGAEVSLIDLADFPLPLFNEDLERDEGTPENARRLKQLFLANHGLLIAAPEYNSSITPLLKNTIDWVSRPVVGEPRLAAYQGKVAALLSASTGALGGLRGLVHVRSILSNIGVLVLPEQITVSNAADAFATDGSLKDIARQARVEEFGRALAAMLTKLSA